ncbi:MAG: flavin reductase family protein [Frankiaceae bacterium]|jgi:flavin reductase (DIM6/NTAB) family NADH-FMN oxidoreductase RutF|nr:flavin reductase family protein [Frankiaceae bacterium]
MVMRVVMGQLDELVLRETYGCFPTGVTAVAAMLDGRPTGMAASSFTSVSIDPPLVSVCIANASRTWPALRGAARLGVSVLGEGHELAARQLAARTGDRFAGLGVEVSEEGAIFIEGSTAWLDCSIRDELPAGDHLIALLRIHGLAAHLDVPPLVFHGSAFRQLATD